MADDDVSLDDLIAIERVAQELWAQSTKGTPDQWQSVSDLAKRAWRRRAQVEVMIWRKTVGLP
jgi:hypothetical protein